MKEQDDGLLQEAWRSLSWLHRRRRPQSQSYQPASGNLQREQSEFCREASRRLCYSQQSYPCRSQ